MFTLLVFTYSLDNLFHSVNVLGENEYLLMYNLRVSITNVSSSPLVLFFYKTYLHQYFNTCSITKQIFDLLLIAFSIGLLNHIL